MIIDKITSANDAACLPALYLIASLATGLPGAAYCGGLACFAARTGRRALRSYRRIFRDME